ncbi:MAG: hypothetical protein B6229_00335 [Spirochaetaceae bacterium 4572_7]|nr:MAG: hypothetical protein B6229_00335 [Spirochaetaceae bacterium 4572_7]
MAIGGIDTGTLTKTLLSPLIWIVIIFFLIFVIVGALWIRKQKKLCYTCLVIRNTGNGKIDLKTMKAGWFKTNSMLGGLWDYGMEEELRTGGFRMPVDKIQGGSTIDFHEINGRRGLICRRKDDDPKILVPLNKLEVENDVLLASIANVDLRDAAVNIIKRAEHETRNRTAEIVQWVLMGGVILLVLVVVIMSYQFVSKAQADSWARLIEAGQIVTGAMPPITAP